MDINQPLDSGINALEITPESRAFLLETAKWGRFLAIVGFVFLGLMVLVGIGGGAFMGSMASELQGASSMMSGSFIMILYLVMALFYFFPTYYLYKFSTNTIRAINSSNSEDLSDGLKNLKSCFKFWGITMAIILSLYGIAIVFGIFGAMLG